MCRMHVIWSIVINTSCGESILGNKYGTGCHNSMRLRQYGHNFADNISKFIFVYGNWCILIQISLKVVPMSLIYNQTALFKIMAWRRAGNKSLSEPMAALQHKILTHSFCLNELTHWGLATHMDGNNLGYIIGLDLWSELITVSEPMLTYQYLDT